MDANDCLLETLQLIHGAGTDSGLWPQALAAITRFTGCWHASLETYDKQAGLHRRWHGHGVSPEMAEDYLAYFGRPGIISINRTRQGFPAGNILDHAGLRRMPFYASPGYLECSDVRDFGAGIIDSNDGETVITIRCAPGTGNIEQQSLERLQALIPHIRLAVDVSERLEKARVQVHGVSAVLDWIDQGACLLRRDGEIVMSNAMLDDILSNGDGLRCSDGKLLFDQRKASRDFAAALGRAASLAEGCTGSPPDPIAVPRPSGLPALVATIRPVLQSERYDTHPDAIAILFLKDPARQGRWSSAADLAAASELTLAESRLALALLDGVSPADYARSNGISNNTVYTHLRRIKDKLGAHRLPQLIGRLNEIAPSGIRTTAVQVRRRNDPASTRTVTLQDKPPVTVPIPPGLRLQTGDGYSYIRAPGMPS